MTIDDLTVEAVNNVDYSIKRDEGVKRMTTQEYRAKHKRCRYCRHQSRVFIQPLGYCQAKAKRTGRGIRALWCKLYALEG